MAFSRRDDDGDGSVRRGGVGILTDDGIYDLTRAALYWNADPDRPVLRHLVRDVSLLILAGPEKLQSAVDLLNGSSGADGVEASFPLVAIDSVDLRAPLLRPPKIVGVGLNYLDHCREQGVFPPQKPLLFAKFANAITDPGAPVTHPEWTSQLDFECELAVVIGSTASHVSVEDAMDHVFGYTILNDVTARDAQKADRQWLRAKGADGFAPLGPVIVTPDELRDPQKLGIGSSVNGEIWQYSSTSEMVFGVAELVSFISQSITLEPGDVIATGTPAGVGHYHKPPRYLEPGDVVRCEIEGIGVLENEIVAAQARSEATGAAPVAAGAVAAGALADAGPEDAAVPDEVREAGETDEPADTDAAGDEAPAAVQEEDAADEAAAEETESEPVTEVAGAGDEGLADVGEPADEAEEIAIPVEVAAERDDDQNAHAAEVTEGALVADITGAGDGTDGTDDSDGGVDITDTDAVAERDEQAEPTGVPS